MPKSPSLRCACTFGSCCDLKWVNIVSRTGQRVARDSSDLSRDKHRAIGLECSRQLVYIFAPSLRQARRTAHLDEQLSVTCRSWKQAITKFDYILYGVGDEYLSLDAWPAMPRRPSFRTACLLFSVTLYCVHGFNVRFDETFRQDRIPSFGMPSHSPRQAKPMPSAGLC